MLCYLLYCIVYINCYLLYCIVCINCYLLYCIVCINCVLCYLSYCIVCIIVCYVICHIVLYVFDRGLYYMHPSLRHNVHVSCVCLSRFKALYKYLCV